MAIPRISREHVEWALEKIDRDGIPKRRHSREWNLVAGGKSYPPKYVLALAARRMTGKELSPQDYSGGEETNKILRDLAYEIQPIRPEYDSPSTPLGPAVNPSCVRIARIIVDGPPIRSYHEGEAVLAAVLRDWPEGEHAHFLITPGGFLCGDELPEGLSGCCSWDSDRRDFPKLTAKAAEIIKEVVTPRVISLAGGKINYLTLGVDLGSEDCTAELVAVLDMGTGKIVGWTGKSYPAPRQEASLIQVADLESHCFRLRGERVLVLGCHDLNMFSPRAWANQSAGSPRRKRCAAMRRLVKDFKPTVVLQHPHYTDTPRTWRMPWKSLEKTYKPTVWASGICHYRSPKGGPIREKKLSKVLDQTRSDNDHFEFIVQTRRRPIRFNGKPVGR